MQLAQFLIFFQKSGSYVKLRTCIVHFRRENTAGGTPQACYEKILLFFDGSHIILGSRYQVEIPSDTGSGTCPVLSERPARTREVGAAAYCRPTEFMLAAAKKLLYCKIRTHVADCSDLLSSAVGAKGLVRRGYEFQ